VPLFFAARLFAVRASEYQIHCNFMATSQQGSMQFNRAQWLGYVSLCLIWGSTWLAIRVAVHDIPPLEAAAIRFVAAGGLLLGLAVLQKRRWPHGRSQWQAIAMLSLTIMAVPYGLLFWAEQHVMSSMTAVLFSAMPLAVSLFTPAMMHRKVPRQAVYAMVIGFGALLTLFYGGGLNTSPRAWIGGVAILVAMTLSAWSVVYAKLRLREVDSVVSTGLQLLFGSVVLSWGTWALEAHRHAVWTRPALLAMAFLTIFGSAAAFVIYYWLLKKFQPYQLSTISLIVPVIAIMEGWLWGEPIYLVMIVAVIIVLGSVRSVLRAEAEKPAEGDLLMLRDRAQ
jgi:drug/metabolite transporter (DMT)-like permease